MHIELLKKYIDNKGSVQELTRVMEWLRDSGETTEGKKMLHMIWSELQDNPEECGTDLNIILDKIHHDINLHQTKLLMKESDDNMVKYGKRRYLLRLFRNAAAMLLFPLLGTTLFFSIRYHSERSGKISGEQAFNEIISSVDAITKLTLPDGSVVWLNHRSSLRYPAVFSGKFRQVELKGEGYFEVAHNPKMPFLVSSGDFQMLARGTVFNVMAYPGEDRIETSLINGNVELRNSSPDGDIVTLYKMKPTDYTVYNKKNKEILTQTITDERYFSWKDGKLIFTSATYGEVVKKLSRWFNVDILIEDPELKDFTLTATIVNESLPHVMELLTIVSPVRYRLTSSTKNVDGSFTRKKVYIYHR